MNNYKIADSHINKVFTRVVKNAPNTIIINERHLLRQPIAKNYFVNELRRHLPVECVVELDNEGIKIYYNNSFRFGNYYGKCMGFQI